MRRSLVSRKEILTEEGFLYFEYLLLSDEISCGSNFSLEGYGVEICSRGPSGASHAQIFPVTTAPSQIETFMELLIRNHVSPISLQDVFFDWASV